MREYVTVLAAARRMGQSIRQIRRMCDDGQFPGAIKHNGVWEIPTESHLQLCRRPEDMPKMTDELLDIAVTKRNDAMRKLGIIRRFEWFAASAKCRKNEAVRMFAAARTDVNARTLQRWLRQYRSKGLLGLVDGRGGVFQKDTITEEAFETFKGLWLDPRRPSVRSCLEQVNYINLTQKKEWMIPSERTLYNFTLRAIPLATRVLYREGLAAYEARCAPYIQCDPDSVEPGQVWIGDHHQFNCWIRYRGQWVRPWVTAWQDMRSRALVGWEISVSPNQTTIMTAMRRAIKKYGPPETVKIDNGRDYDSEMWTGTTKQRRRAAIKKGYLDEFAVAGIYAMMDVTISFAIPYHPQSKPIERLFDTVDKQFTKTFDTYCGKDVNRRPEDVFDLLKTDSAVSCAHTAESFSELFGEYAEAYNASSHSGNGMEGLSPNEVMAQRHSRRALAEGVLDLLMRSWSGELTIGKNGVRYKSIYYGQYDPELLSRQGKKVRVSCDPDDMRTVQVYDAVTWRLITIAEQNELVQWGGAVSDEDLRQAMREKSRSLKFIKGFVDNSRVAATDLTTLAIKAKRAAAKADGADARKTARIIRPVRTPLDGQVRETKRKETVRRLKKAAGAEGTEPLIDIDYSLLKSSNPYKGMKLLDD